MEKKYILGAVCGDVAGSTYEVINMLSAAQCKKRPDTLVAKGSRFTDDTVMTCAVADALAILQDYTKHGKWNVYNQFTLSLHEWGNRYLNAGYGRAFLSWLQSDNPQPYGSWGNGSAMRVSYIGWAAKSLEDAEKLAELSAVPTHNHLQGVNGAKVIAGCIYLLRQGKSKSEIEEYAAKYYDMSFTLDEIRDDYTFEVSCQGSVPQAIRAFLEGESFEDVLTLAISIGGDSDTIAAIACSLAEVIYPIDKDLEEKVLSILTDEIKDALQKATAIVLASQTSADTESEE